MLVPWILVAAPFGAMVMRFVQAAILEEIDSDYVRTAVAKGLSRRDVIRRHAARRVASRWPRWSACRCRRS